MSSPVHSITYQAVFTATPYPAGTIAGPVLASLLGSTGNVVAGPTALVNGAVTFTAIPDGVYTLSVQATDSHGSTLQAPYTVAVTVADQPASIAIPSGGTVTVN
jgi:hypothetical protein